MNTETKNDFIQTKNIHDAYGKVNFPGSHSKNAYVCLFFP